MTALRERERAAYELMDDPDCDLDALRQTYRQFAVVNRLVSGWRRIYRTRIRPTLSAERITTVLDIGCGDADVARALLRWAARDGLALTVTAIDPDPRAHEFAAGQPTVPGLTVRRASSTELVAAGERFDMVVSNHLLHHLSEAELAGLLSDSAALGERLVVHNDLARSRVAYVAYAIACHPPGRPSFLRADGLLSIRRSYRAGELAARVPEGWQVQRQWPYRVLVVREPGGATQ